MSDLASDVSNVGSRMLVMTEYGRKPSIFTMHRMKLSYLASEETFTTRQMQRETIPTSNEMVPIQTATPTNTPGKMSPPPISTHPSLPITTMSTPRPSLSRVAYQPQ